jgi:hypothetical protein
LKFSWAPCSIIPAKSGDPVLRETKADAEAAFGAFIESYQVKYQTAAECLNKDRDMLLTFYDCPAEHWKNLRTTSTFATVRHRPAPHDPLEAPPVQPHRARNDLQACRSCAEKLATPRRQQTVAKINSRCEIRRTPTAKLSRAPYQITKARA